MNINFKREFALLVESGVKRQTIRQLPRWPRKPDLYKEYKPGQVVNLYTGLRQKHARKLMTVEIASVESIQIHENHKIFVEGKQLSSYRSSILAEKDGFPLKEGDNIREFVSFFEKAYSLPFGVDRPAVLLKWHIDVSMPDNLYNVKPITDYREWWSLKDNVSYSLYKCKKTEVQFIATRANELLPGSTAMNGIPLYWEELSL